MTGNSAAIPPSRIMTCLAPRFHWRLFWIYFLSGVIVAVVLLKILAIQEAGDEWDPPGEASPLVGVLMGVLFAPAIVLMSLVGPVVVPLLPHGAVEVLGYLMLLVQIAAYAWVPAAKEWWRDKLRPGHGRTIAVTWIILHVGCVVWALKHMN
jgi:hypothetical protein